ncbi:ParA family protein [Haliangium ochraceum]|uniref:Cobyrinic acid a,c-diamide synthase n=1 Tax=Haliangium ochraceum (strain DSM 14365 / JCM 11303 / SMP-2) TaxID=502025 RepID=D0LNS4_HALO1|nr:ParA family protein [Haliangium ochraceum]ACY16979.1 cobyrinic acid a,c-diamide synthase [Haliangium ochraceum DSM 14365]
MSVLCFFNNRARVGKTTLVFHTAWQLADLGHRVVVVDFDPQACLTSLFLEPEGLSSLLADADADAARTVYQAARPLALGAAPRHLTLRGLDGDERLWLLPGDVGLAALENVLSERWSASSRGVGEACHASAALARVVRQCAAQVDADVVLVDLGPSLGAINRAALLCADHVLVPVGADVFSIYGLGHLGDALARWRSEWAERREHLLAESPAAAETVPVGAMRPVGYVATQHAQQSNNPASTHRRWTTEIPAAYARAIGGESPTSPADLDKDRNCLARLKDYQGLMTLAQEARKPIFHLSPEDGALGSHFYAAKNCGKDFEAFAQVLSQRCGFARAPRPR